MISQNTRRGFRFVRKVAALIPLSLAVACGGEVVRAGSDDGLEGGPDGSGDAKASGPVPLNHRPNDSQCQTPAAPGNCSWSGMPPEPMCTKDSACTTGNDGRCISNGLIAGCHCTYDTCASDNDCPAGELCACHGSPYTFAAGNTCVPGNCRVDSDCGAHGYCSPTTSFGHCGRLTGYYCHTSSDQCVDDSDCPSGPCAWSATGGRWECLTVAPCG
jgi:hypothetical protein